MGLRLVRLVLYLNAEGSGTGVRASPLWTGAARDLPFARAVSCEGTEELDFNVHMNSFRRRATALSELGTPALRRLLSDIFSFFLAGFGDICHGAFHDGRGFGGAGGLCCSRLPYPEAVEIEFPQNLKFHLWACEIFHKVRMCAFSR